MTNNATGSKEKVLVVWPDAKCTRWPGNGLWVVERAGESMVMLGVGQTHEAAWDDAASKLPAVSVDTEQKTQELAANLREIAAHVDSWPPLKLANAEAIMYPENRVDTEQDIAVNAVREHIVEDATREEVKNLMNALHPQIVTSGTVSEQGGTESAELLPQILAEIYRAFEKLGAQSDLLGTIGSWCDCLPDEDVLANLQAWNAATPNPSHRAFLADKSPQSGIALIAAERARQVAVEGWTPEHDDAHRGGQLAYAATVYAHIAANQATGGPVALEPSLWPWDIEWYKSSSDPISNLVKAGALITAEIDRLQRAKGEHRG